jgi:hypothetical protein
MEGDLFRFDFTIFDFYLVSGQDNGDVLTHAGKITMPVGNIFVCDTGGNVEHDDSALSLDVVSIAETSEFFLSCGIPNIEFNGSAIGVECEGVDFHSECRDVLFLEFSGKVTLYKSCFSDSSISDKNEFEFRYSCRLVLVVQWMVFEWKKEVRVEKIGRRFIGVRLRKMRRGYNGNSMYGKVLEDETLIFVSYGFSLNRDP